jgi:hypothetical protein
MERKYILLLVLISFLLTNVVAYLDEGLHSFEYLNHGSDWVALLVYTIIFLIIPLILFFGIRKSYKGRFTFSLFGFVPTVMLILLQLG